VAGLQLDWCNIDATTQSNLTPRHSSPREIDVPEDTKHPATTSNTTANDCILQIVGGFRVEHSGGEQDKDVVLLMPLM
jgi:hypothetical protein